jgi:hypothetical protein
MNKALEAHLNQKHDKSSVAYELPAKGPDHCGICEHFEPPHECSEVEGTIQAAAWCRLFEEKT